MLLTWECNATSVTMLLFPLPKAIGHIFIDLQVLQQQLTPSKLILFLIITQHAWGTLLCWLCTYICSPSLPGVYLWGEILVFLCHYNLNYLFIL